MEDKIPFRNIQGDDKIRESAFNIAIKFLEGIQQNITEANYFSRQEDYKMWYQTLECIYRKVFAKMKEAERKKFERIRADIGNNADCFAQAQTLSDNVDIPPASEFVDGVYTPPYLEGAGNFILALKVYERELISVLDRVGWLVPTRKTIFDMAQV